MQRKVFSFSNMNKKYILFPLQGSVKWFSRYFIVYEPNYQRYAKCFLLLHACMHSWNHMLVRSTLIPFCMTLSLLTWRYSPICNELSISFFCKQIFQTKIRLCINCPECFPEKVLNVLPILGKRYMPLSTHSSTITLSLVFEVFRCL
jgi:hypothetical protein